MENPVTSSVGQQPGSTQVASGRRKNLSGRFGSVTLGVAALLVGVVAGGAAGILWGLEIGRVNVEQQLSTYRNELEAVRTDYRNLLRSYNGLIDLQTRTAEKLQQVMTAEAPAPIIQVVPVPVGADGASAAGATPGATKVTVPPASVKMTTPAASVKPVSKPPAKPAAKPTTATPGKTNGATSTPSSSDPWESLDTGAPTGEACDC